MLENDDDADLGIKDEDDVKDLNGGQSRRSSARPKTGTIKHAGYSCFVKRNRKSLDLVFREVFFSKDNISWMDEVIFHK